jgi:hypothetical protein
MKATVTIIFNNKDVAGSPVGYETSKEITVTRQVAFVFFSVFFPFLSVFTDCHWW